ncbi:hypothetical protein PFISCL1PPCAC_23775, partial [Pristionchus fissidentatus]
SMPRGKSTHDTDTVSDPSEGEFDSDDSLLRKPRKKVAKKEQPKPKAARKPSPTKRPQKSKEAASEDAGFEKPAESDEEDEHDALAQEYDEEDLVNIVVPPAPEPIMQTSGGKRLMITDITVENFKSYYGVRRIGPFHHSFTSIIGPNGSGKSNVIDALLFVFGYKASKIRSKKVSVLIHASAGKDQLNSCSVRITMQMIVDNPDGTYTPVPNSGFNVSRTAYKNNTSEYRMNGTKMTIKQVAVKLREVGIDLVHNRFLILQGEVEMIAMMKPKAQNPGEEGMLEYLEDIIGSSRFKVPIEKLTTKLEKLQTDKSHQNAKVNTALREKESLDEPVQLTLSYLSMENEVAALKCKQNLDKKYNAQDAVYALQPEIKRVQEELETVDKGLEEVAEKMKEKKAIMEEATKELDQAKADIARMTGEAEVIEQRDTKRINDMNRMTADIKKLSNEMKKEQQKLEEATRAPIDAKAKIDQLKIQLEEHKDELTTAQDMFDENFPKYNKKTEAERAKKVKLEEEYSGVAAKLAEAEAKCKMAEASLRSMSEEFEKRKAQLAEVEKALQTNSEELEKKKGEASTARENCARFEDENREARQEFDDVTERIEHNRKRLTELQPMFTEKQAEAQQRQVMGKISNLFDDAVKRGRMKGYHGRLGDLGSIDAKYDRAMSNNFPSVDNHIADDTRTANEGFDLLKAIGSRTNFILLEKQQHLWSQIRKCEAEKGQRNLAPRLFNLIECADEYKPAFFMVVRWSYVVDNMQEAHKLYKTLVAQNRREQIVTLDGCMLTRKGGFVGGGQVKEGKMGGAKVARRDSSVKDDERNAQKLEDARKEHEALTAENLEMNQHKRKLEYKINQIAAPAKREKDMAQLLEKQIKVLDERIKVQEQQRKEKEKEVEKTRVDEGELEEKREEIEKLKKDRDSQSAHSKTFKAKIKEVDNEMLKVYTKLVKPYEETRDSARDAIAAAEKEISKLHAVINGAERNIAKQQSRCEEITGDLDGKRNKTTTLTQMEDTYSKRRIQLVTESGAAKEVKERAEEKIKELRSATSELDKEEVAIQKQHKLLVETKAEMKGKMKGLEKAIVDYDNLITEIKLHNITELLYDIPQDMQQSSSTRLFLLDGESDSDIDDYEEFMTGSPTKKKELKESKRSRKDEAKRRKMDEDGDEEEEGGEDEDEPMEEAAATTGDEEPMEQEETEEQREAKKTVTKREKKQKEQEMIRSGQMPDWSREHIKKMDKNAIKMNLDDLEKRMASMKKDLQPHVLEDYRRKVDKLRGESEALRVVTKKYSDHRETLERLKKERLADFMGGFESISTALREMYQMITLGGDASLELKDLIDPFLEGVQFMVRPPKKSWKQIENLSGGEKTLSSLSLVFALHKYRPTPLYVMDEIDAALDFRNVSIIGHYIKDRTKNAQFIIISLRNNMFELADRLIGIYKVHDCTRNVVVDPKKVLEETKDLRSGLDKVRRLMESNKIQTGVGV